MGEQEILGGIMGIERSILRRFWGDELTARIIAGDHFEPCVDVFETAEGTVVKMEIPGMRKKDIIVEFEGDTLVIRGRRDDKSPKQKITYHQMEIDYGTFERRLKIEMPVREEGVTACYKDGFLEVSLPRKRSSKRKAVSQK